MEYLKKTGFYWLHSTCLFRAFYMIDGLPDLAFKCFIIFSAPWDFLYFLKDAKALKLGEKGRFIVEEFSNFFPIIFTLEWKNYLRFDQGRFLRHRKSKLWTSWIFFFSFYTNRLVVSWVRLQRTCIRIFLPGVYFLVTFNGLIAGYFADFIQFSLVQFLGFFEKLVTSSGTAELFHHFDE